MTIATNAPDYFGFPVVDIPATANTPEATIRFLVGQLVAAGQIMEDAIETVVGQVLRREMHGTTGIGKGIAIPHASSEAVGQIAVVVGRVTGPLAWPTLDSAPVRLISLVVSPRSKMGDHLQAMEALVRRLRGDI
jgi:mannitol/fructose-specific phosphotransferase system IIA component (Ntr-type)